MAPIVWITIGVVVVVDRIRRRRKAKDLVKIPRAPGHIPFIGNVGIMKEFQNHRLHKTYEQFAVAAGPNGLLQWSVMGMNRVVATTPQGFADVLRKTGFLQKPTGTYNIFFLFGTAKPSLFNHPDSEEHSRIRKHLMRFFNAENIAATIKELSGEVRRTIDMIAAADSRSLVCAEIPDDERVKMDADGKLEVGVYHGNGEGALVNAFQIAATIILRVVFKVFLEVDILPPMDVFADVMAQANEIAAHPLQYRLLTMGLYPGRKRFRRNWEALHNYHKELMHQVYNKPLPENSTAFWAAVRYAFPDAMTDDTQFEYALANTSFIYGAGYETTANAITHTLSALAIDQDSQTAVTEELADMGLLATAERPNPRAIEAEDLSKMPFLDAICHESLRLMTTAPNGGFRVLAKDTKVCGHTLPKGTEVMLPVWSMHHNKHVWGEDASSWRPDRWLEGASVASARKDADGNPRFLSFLDGASNCIGQHLAMTEIKLTIASLVSKLHITMDAQRMGHVRTVDEYLEAAVTKITLQHDSPSWLRMKQRASSTAVLAAQGDAVAQVSESLTQPVAQALAAAM